MCDNHIGLLLCFLQAVSLKFKLTLFGSAQFALMFECGTWKRIYILMLWRSGMQDVNGKNCSRSNVWDCLNRGCSFRLRTHSNRDWESRNLCGAVRTAQILTANVLMRKGRFRRLTPTFPQMFVRSQATRRHYYSKSSAPLVSLSKWNGKFVVGDSLMRAFLRGAKIDPWGTPVSTSFVGCCCDRFRIPLLHKCQRSVGYHLHCNFLSFMMLLMVVTSRQRQESDGSHCGVCSFLVRETHRAVIYALTPSCLHVLIPGLTPGDKRAGYFKHSFLILNKNAKHTDFTPSTWQWEHVKHTIRRVIDHMWLYNL